MCVIMLSFIMLSVTFSYYYAVCQTAQCRYAQCHNAQCGYARCHYAECCGANMTFRHCFPIARFKFEKFSATFILILPEVWQ
jgi:hypothetical protein